MKLNTGISLTELKDSLSKELFSITRADALEQGICVDCKMPAKSRCYSDAGRREYRISAICEICFDKMFEEN